MKTKPSSTLGLALLAAVGLTTLAIAQNGPGWTGTTNPQDVIAARQALMLAIEDLMRPIDTYTVDPTEDPDVLVANAATIDAMLQAVPHLFPPTTNLYDADAELPETLALPNIWENFPAFYTMAAASRAAALALAEAQGADALRNGALNLRATCDSCHALNLRPYVPSAISDEDRNFDFDSLFNGDK
jgi:cytochrome c556